MVTAPMRGLFILLCLQIIAVAPAQLTGSEVKGISDALYLSNLTPRDLDYERQPFHDKFRMSLVDLAIRSPLVAADEIMRLHQSARASLAQTLRSATRQFGDPPIAEPPVPLRSTLLNLPPTIEPIVSSLIDALFEANSEIRAATIRLSAAERREIVEGLPRWATEEPSIKFDFVKQPLPDRDRLFALISRIDLRRIRRASVVLADRVEAAIPTLQALAPRVEIKGILRVVSRGVVVEIGGNGDDVHTSKDTNLCIDFGGNDTYTGRFGAGVDYASVLIDLSGNDRYQTPDLSVGSGILGIGLAYDLGGDDSFSGGSMTFGCGLAGVGGLSKRGGRDQYRSIALSQGFGEFGIGVLDDTGGDDNYDVQFYGQGAARTQGVGWLVDLAGNDVYRAGGLILNSPLFATAHYSNAQGYASGYREDLGGISGGIGLLTDLNGDDAYLGETYCQAASYWFSLGSLYDASGNDTYSAYHYGQASAMHMTAAYLFDLAGDDSYTLKVGAGLALGHDYGVAFLLDRAGDDIYAGRDSRPGQGIANGVGIFVDAAGEDTYTGSPGIGNPGRGSGSIGLFVDLGGPDHYASGLANGEANVSGRWSIAYDVDAPPTDLVGTGSASSKEETAVKPGSVALTPAKDLAELYRKASQWGVGTAQAEVKSSLRQLIGMGMPALEWMVQNRLASADRLAIRTFVAVVNGIGGSAGRLVAERIASPNPVEALAALRTVNDAKVAGAGPFVVAALKNPSLRRNAAVAAGTLGLREAVADLLPLSANPDRILALDAVVALVQIGDEAALSTAQGLLNSPELPIREAALDLLAKFPAQALEVAKSRSLGPTEWDVRMGIQLLSAVGSEEALVKVGSYLSSESPGLRIEALRGLNGRCPSDFRAKMLSLGDDVDPRVKAVARHVDLGRQPGK